MRLSGTYFELTDRFAPGTRSRAGKTEEGSAAPSGMMVISVAKRLVASAVRRNTVKRVVREAWRAANAGDRGAGQSPGPGTRACLVRLKRYPGTSPRTRGKPVAPQGAAGPPASVPPASPGFATVKRELRADADRLFAAFLKNRAGPTRFT